MILARLIQVLFVCCKQWEFNGPEPKRYQVTEGAACAAAPQDHQAGAQTQGRV